MSEAEIRDLQRSINAFTDRYLDGVTPLRVDGEMGPATKARIKSVKYYLGYPKSERDGKAGARLRWRLKHPKKRSKQHDATVSRIATGNARRVAQRARVKKHRAKAAKTTGVGSFDGVPCANWLIPYLKWAREHGHWKGRLVSGWRDPVYSEGLCKRMCGRSSCPGRCAGRASNHSGSSKPRGALDVTYYADFGAAMRRCPLQPRLYNALGPADPVHYSASGR